VVAPAIVIALLKIRDWIKRCGPSSKKKAAALQRMLQEMLARLKWNQVEIDPYQSIEATRRDHCLPTPSSIAQIDLGEPDWETGSKNTVSFFMVSSSCSVTWLVT